MDKRTLEILDNIPMPDLFSMYDVEWQEGRNFKCPFPEHDATGSTPSAHYYPHTNSIGCFGCHKGGGPIHFVMNMEQVDFDQATKILRTRFKINEGYHFSYDKFMDKMANKKLLYLDKVKVSYYAQYYKKCFSIDPDLSTKLFNIIYLTRNLFSEDKIFDLCRKASELVSCPDELKIKEFFAQFKTPIENLCINANIAKDCGQNYGAVDSYIRQRSFDTLQDYFVGFSKGDELSEEFAELKNRMLFPYIMAPNYVVGFSGRVFGNFIAKYLTLFSFGCSKGDFLYGLNVAYKHIVEQGRVYIVEGILDVIRMNRLGIFNVVTPLGTYFTYNQASQLSVYTDTVVLLYDEDFGGSVGFKKAREMGELFKFKVLEFHLPPKEDPDSYGLKDPQKFIEDLNAIE